MKPTNKPKAGKKPPKGTVMYAHFEPSIFGGECTVHNDRHDAWCRMMSYGHGDIFSCAVIPCATKKEARQWVRLAKKFTASEAIETIQWGLPAFRL